MLLSQAKEYFGSWSAIAKALEGQRTEAAVYLWKKKGVVPFDAARKLVAASNGVLQVDESLYDNRGRIRRL